MKNKPLFGSLGSNYSWKFLGTALLGLFRSATTEERLLGAELYRLFPKFNDQETFYSGRDAVTSALDLLGVSKGDGVLLQAFTCAAVEEAVLRTGAEPVFVDVGSGEVNLNVETLEHAFSESQVHCKAVIVQHTLGVPAEIEKIRTWCDERELLLIEDLAQSIGAVDIKGDLLGTHADAVALSFGRDKIIDAVHGGVTLAKTRVESSGVALVVNTSNKSSFHTISYIATTLLVRTFHDVGVGKVIYRLAKELGIIYSPVIVKEKPGTGLNKLNSRLALSQTKVLLKSVKHRQNIAKIYFSLLKKYSLVTKEALETGSFVRFPISISQPDQMSKQLQRENIFITDRWYRAPVDSGSHSWKTAYRDGSCPNAEALSESVLTLPTHPGITPDDAVRIASAIVVKLEEAPSFTKQEIESEEIWESLIAFFPETNFLQSWAWGEFQKNLGKKIFRIALFDNEKIVALAQGVIESARRSTYCTVAGGPLVNWTNIFALNAIITEIKNMGLHNQCSFVRFRPQVADNELNTSICATLGSINSPMHVTADLTIKIDLTLGSEEILKQMRKNTRGSIRKAEKLGITTTITKNAEEIRSFYDLQAELASRHGFVPFSLEFLEEQFKAFAARDQAILVHSWDGETLLASAFVIFYNSQAAYHYGVSSEANSRLPGSYAVQWRVIQEAIERGMTTYNLWGVAPEGEKDHRYAGVSLFKRGFGGEELAYLPAHDIPLNKWYWPVRSFELMRKKLRHL